jgi:hypothetical protein
MVVVTARDRLEFMATGRRGRSGIGSWGRCRLARALGALVVGVVDHGLDEASDAVGNRCEGCPDGPSRSSDVDGLAV